MPPTHEDPSIYAFLGGTPAEQLAWLTSRGLPPATLLALHNSCAQRCFFCVAPGTVAVPAEEVTSRVRASSQLAARPPGVERLLIGGNEPTLHPDFPALLAAARPAGFRTIELMTNGYNLTTHAGEYAAAGVSEVVVPLYAAESALHDEVCGAVVYAAVVAGLDAAAAAGITVRVHTLLLRRNLAALAGLAEMVATRWSSRLGVALLRDKGSFDFAGEAPAFDAAAATIAAISPVFRPFGIGTPRCLPTAEEDPPLVAELYFRSQARAKGAACVGCVVSDGCGGPVLAYREEVRPLR